MTIIQMSRYWAAGWGGWWPIPLNWLIAYYPFDSDMNDHKADLGATWTTYNCTAWSWNYSYIAWKVSDCIDQDSEWSWMAIDTWINWWCISLW